MISDRKLEANRLNAQKSSGPKTKRGKRRSRFNACTHRYFCRHLVLTGECEEEFIIIREEMLESLKPQNLAELLVVDRIVSAMWKLKRLQESEAVAHGCYAKQARGRLRRRADRIEKDYYGDDVAPKVAKLREQAKTCVLPPSIALGNTIAADNDQFERLLMYEQRLENSIHRAFRDLNLLRKNAKQTSELPNSPFTAESRLTAAEQCLERVRELARTIHQNAQNEPTEKSPSTDDQASTCDDFSGATENPPKATDVEYRADESPIINPIIETAAAPPHCSETQNLTEPCNIPQQPMTPAPSIASSPPHQSPNVRSLLVWVFALLLTIPALARAATWDDYPGSLDLGGWSVVRNHDNPSEVVLLGPPHNAIIVGSAAEPLTAFLFSPDFIFAQTGARRAEKYYVVERGWPTDRETGDQTILKFTGPISSAQFNANSTWTDEMATPDWNVPRAPNGSIFWKKPGVVILYSLIILGPLILIVLVPIVVIVLLITARRRNRAAATHQRAGGGAEAPGGGNEMSAE